MATKGITWVKPQLVAQIAFSNWTRDSHLRHPSFQGLREDKPAAEVTREQPKRTKANAESKSAKPQTGTPKKSVAARTSAAETTLAGVRLTHPEKMLYPDAKITKRDLADYYLAHAERILPHIVGRPLSIVRCPEGVEGQRFFQKHPGMGTPAALARVKIRENKGVAEYLMVEDAAGLVALAQICALEIHVWGSRADAVERPDRLVFDLDPAPEIAWNRVKDSAKELRQFFADLGLVSFLKTSGGKGLHLVLPITRKREWDEVAEFCQSGGREPSSERRPTVTSRICRSKNAAVRSSSIICATNGARRPSPPIRPAPSRSRRCRSPLAWEQLGKLEGPDSFRLSDADRLLSGRRKDPWAELASVEQSLTRGMFHTLEKNVL